MTFDEVLRTLQQPGTWVGFCLGLGVREAIVVALRVQAKRLIARARATPDKADDADAAINAAALNEIASTVRVLPLRQAKDKRPLGGE